MTFLHLTPRYAFGMRLNKILRTQSLYITTSSSCLENTSYLRVQNITTKKNFHSFEK